MGKKLMWLKDAEETVLAGMLRGHVTSLCKAAFWSQFHAEVFVAIRACVSNTHMNEAARKSFCDAQNISKYVSRHWAGEIEDLLAHLWSMSPTQADVDRAEMELQMLDMASGEFVFPESRKEVLTVEWTKACEWLNETFAMLEELESCALLEFVAGLDVRVFEEHVAFVRDCLAAGIKPVHFAATIRDMWKMLADEISKTQEQLRKVTEAKDRGFETEEEDDDGELCA